MRKAYRPDHTTHIRRRLCQQAIYYWAGLVAAAVGFVTVRLIAAPLGTLPHLIAVATSFVPALLAGVSAVGLLITGGQYVRYRKMRPLLKQRRPSR
jgi:predicted lysophospholipase L1 biosynthesis ABC-type transport system permease subunit